jgi:adenylosuccinate lyase
MISRYQSKHLHHLWSLKHRYETFLKVELASAKALFERGIIDIKTLKNLELATIDIQKIEEKEAVLKHDVLAFIEATTESLGPEKTFFHFGLTSTDVVDTALSLILKDVHHHILKAAETLKQTILEQSKTYKDTLMMARTHGMYAEVSSFGFRLLRFYEDLTRTLNEMNEAFSNLSVIKLSGAVGTYSILPMEHETLVKSYLGLGDAILSTQVLARDRHARYIASLALVSSVIEDFVLDIRLLSRSDVLEVSEGFSKNQKGSSAMPHKKNPITSENLTGLARMMRGYVTMVFENIALWHERDISHSSVERVVLEDATSLLEHSLISCAKLVDDLVVHKDNMLNHIHESFGTAFSQTYLHIAILKGFDRIQTYERLQALSFEALKHKTPLIEGIIKDPFFKSIALELESESTLEKKKENMIALYDYLYSLIIKNVL